MRRGLSLLIILLVSQSLSFAQTAPLGKDLVKSFSERMLSYKSVVAQMDFTIENLQEEISETFPGTLKLRGESYYLELMEMQVYFNGKTKWQFIPAANEVTISEPAWLEGGFFENPTQIFRDYEKDFKSRFIGEKVINKQMMYEVDLYPEDISEPFSIIKITFKKENLEPVFIKYQGRDGVNYLIEIKQFKTTEVLEDREFVFVPEKYKNIIVVDLR